MKQKGEIMQKPDSGLFQIGEAAKLIGVSRKIILNYEALGLIKPAYQGDNGGYRYYTADNLTQIASIRALQTLGLSLAEVREYYNDMTNIEAHIKRLTDLRELLNRNIQLLELRASERGDMTVRSATLPDQVCFCRRYLCKDSAEAAVYLRNTYIDAARTGLMSRKSRMFTVRLSEGPEGRELLCCIPIDPGYKGDERMEFPQTPAICIYYRGPYEGIPGAISVLTHYAEEKQLKAAGPFRSIYLEGPPNRGTTAEDYITQVALPIFP